MVEVSKGCSPTISADSAAGSPFAIEMYTPPRYRACMNTPIAQLSNIPSRFGHLGRAINTMVPSNRTAPNIRKKRKVSGSAYGRPSFAPMKPDAHKMTNNPGAATIVKCSIGEIDELELLEVMRLKRCQYLQQAVYTICRAEKKA